MPTYELCKQLLNRGMLTAEMLDTFYVCKRLTAEQFKGLMAAIQPTD